MKYVVEFLNTKSEMLFEYFAVNIEVSINTPSVLQYHMTWDKY